MGKLLSCPFCRELFADDEGPNCPECDLPLVALEKLPLSLEGQAEAQAEDVDPPEDQRLPLFYLRRGRGALLLASVVGLGLFLSPWVEMLRPDDVTLAGIDLAKSYAPWLWGGGVAWFLLFPLVVSRRSVTELRGVRAIACLFCLMTAGETIFMLLRPPAEHSYFTTGLSYTWGLYASLLCSLVGSFFALRLGGSLEDLRDLPVEVPASGPQPGEALH